MGNRILKQMLLASIIIAWTALSALAGESKDGGHKRTGKAVHWGYSGAQGPGHWGDLSDRYALCKTGQQQSPIDIGETQQSGLAAFTVDYRTTPLQVVNNGHTIQANYAAGSTLTLGRRVYQLAQFHFHSPSENLLNGKQFDMEIHFVHKDQAGRLGVLGVFVEKGAANPALAEIWRHLPQGAQGKMAPQGVAINGADLLPPDRRYYRFVGSLTTPPCSEGVQWHVLKQPITASTEQIDAFLHLIGPNNRPVQKINNRLLIDSQTVTDGKP